MRRAFTLIEALIAVALGAMLCGAAVAAVRVAANAAATAGRLSTENGVLTLALTRAWDELDTWTAYDDPADPSRQPLRAPGHPFQPLAFDRDDFRLDFAHHDPRTWWRGAAFSTTDRRLGDYALFASTGAATAERRWYGAMLDGLSRELGDYAMVDYMPANTVFAWYGDDGTAPATIASPSSGPGVISGAWYANRRPRGLLGMLHSIGYCITTDPTYLAAGVDHAAFTDAAGGMWNAGGKLFAPESASAVRFLDLAPATFPTVSIRLTRCMDFGWPRDHALATIVMTSPITAQRVRLTQHLTATTLRGARRQRGLDR